MYKYEIYYPILIMSNDYELITSTQPPEKAKPNSGKRTTNKPV